MNFELQKQAVERVKYYIDLARSSYNIPRFDCTIEFSYKLGRSAGLCKFKSKTGKITVIFNAVLLPDNKEDFFNATIPHEVAHAVDFYLRGKSDHGRNWQSIMFNLGANPKRTHDMDTRKSAKGGLFLYKCEVCSAEVELGKIRHNRLQKDPTKYSHACSRATRLVPTLNFIKSL